MGELAKLAPEGVFVPSTFRECVEVRLGHLVPFYWTNWDNVAYTIQQMIDFLGCVTHAT